MIRSIILVICAGILSFTSCKQGIKELPYLGRININEAGEEVKHTIRPWQYVNQDSVVITNKILAGKPYIADFFFTSCPSICPKVTKQMLRLHERYMQDSIVLISFTIDPKRDSPEVLKRYAQNLEVNTEKWHFLTGDKSFTLDLADDYFVAAFEDPDAPGGFDHSGKILLVDGNGHVRSFAEGTDAEDVTEFFKDVDFILDK